MRMPPNKRHSQHIDPGGMGCFGGDFRQVFLENLPERLRAADKMACWRGWPTRRSSRGACDDVQRSIGGVALAQAGVDLVQRGGARAKLPVAKCIERRIHRIE